MGSGNSASTSNQRLMADYCSMRRGRASALNRIAIAFVLLHELEDVEAFQLSIREEAVHRIVLIAEELKGNGQLSQQEKFQMRPIDVGQRQLSTSLAQPGESKYQRPQSGAVNVADVFEI